MSLALAAAVLAVAVPVIWVMMKRRCWACTSWNRGKGPSCRTCGMPSSRRDVAPVEAEQPAA